MGRPLLLREYGCLLAADRPAQESPDVIHISRRDFAALRRLCLPGREKAETADRPASASHDVPADLARFRGREALRVRSCVGVLLLPSGQCVEILPKIYNDATEPEQVRALLLTMLRCLPDLPFAAHGTADVREGRLPLLEVFLTCFLDEATRLLRAGLRSDYAEREENLTCLRGRLLLSEHVRRNAAHRERLYVRHDEFLPDRPENRLLKSTLLKVAGLTRHADNQRRCRRLLFMLDEVSLSTRLEADFSLCRHDRSTRHYENALTWAALLLRGNAPLPLAGPRTCLSLLFPMERVFEVYVAAKLPRQFPAWSIQSQASGRHLVDACQGRPRFRLRPDLLLHKGPLRCVADTKWKLPQGLDDIQRADLYQLFAYSEKYLADQDVRRSFLIYPRTERFARPMAPLYFSQPRAVLTVVPFDLETARLVLDEADEALLRG